MQGKRNGAACAAIFAASSGIFIFGFVILWASADPQISQALNWALPVGPLSGKVGVGILAWIIPWFFLHFVWSKRELNFNRVLFCSISLMAIGMILMFPPVFEAFAH